MMSRADYDERAAILEFDGGLSRADAEAQALRDIYGQLIADASGIMAELIRVDRRRWQPEIAAQLAALGLASVRGPAWGLSAVVPEGDTYRPALDGEKALHAFIVPAVVDGAVVDLVACTIVRPRRMRSRLGVACVVGADEISRARETVTPLYVFEDAAQWLYGHTRGAVILDWQRGVGEVEGVAELICSATTAPRLYEATRRCWPRPTIAFTAEARNVAA